MLECSRAPELVYKVLESERASEKGGTEGVGSSIEGKACCYLSSGTEEEMRGSSGRICDQRMRPALEQAESNWAEPTGVEFSVANFISLPSVAPEHHSSVHR